MQKTQLIKADEVEPGNILLADDHRHIVKEVNVERFTVFLVLQREGIETAETVPVNSTAWLVVYRPSLTDNQRKNHGTS